MKCSRGKARKNGGAKGCGKAADWKSQKTTFPLRLEIPQTPAGFPLSHSLGDCGTLTTNRTFHLLRKGDTSNVVSRGTFLMSVDISLSLALTVSAHSHTLLSTILGPWFWAPSFS
jgi:hypothetical protein